MLEIIYLFFPFAGVGTALGFLHDKRRFYTSSQKKALGMGFLVCAIVTVCEGDPPSLRFFGEAALALFLGSMFAIWGFFVGKFLKSVDSELRHRLWLRQRRTP